MDNILNYNGKVPEETLSGSNLDSVKTTLRGLHNFKMTLANFQILKNLLAIPLSLCHMQKRMLRIAQ